MGEPAMIMGQRRPVRAGVRGGITATGQGLAFATLAAGQLGLLLLLLLAPILLGLAVAVLLADHGIGARQQVVLALVLLAAGLVVGRLAAVPSLLGLRNLARLTRRLLGDWAGIPVAEAYQPLRSGPRPPFHERLYWLTSDPATRRDLVWSAVNVTFGWLIAALPALAVVGGCLLSGSGLGGGFGSSSSSAVVSAKPGAVGLPSVPTPASHTHSAGAPLEVLFGLTLVCLGVAVAPWLLRGYTSLARTLLAPAGQAELAQRVYHLAQTRTETLDSGAAEIRRIERDLHDGAQARLVAVGMTLGAAEDLIGTSPDAARALLTEARTSSAQALAELRALVRGIHPPVLADRGLADAVRALALDSGLKVEIVASLPGRPQPPVESAAYFAVCELLANISKHAGTRQAWIDLHYERGLLRIDVTDNGSGGADPADGTGLRGIERRVAAFDGILALSSPVGGPTVATLEVPCALSSPKTSSC
jgi:signal transduction histidine kinase